MRPSAVLASHQDAIRNIVLAHRAGNPRVFGSVMAGDDRDGSDIDILVDPAPGMTLLDLGAMRHELKTLLGVEVDVLTPKSLPIKFRERVLSEAVPV